MTNGFLADSNAVLLDPASFDQGSHPQALIPDASNTAGAISAGPGSVKIEIELFDSPLQLTISLARTDAVVDAAGSALDASGVKLDQGQLARVEAEHRKLPHVSLSTFRDLPWNGPFYASMGFREISRQQFEPYMIEIEEAQKPFMDVTKRCFMRRKVRRSLFRFGIRRSEHD